MTTAADFPLYRYRGEPIAVHDGDTFRVVLDLGLRVFHEVSLRIAGIDAPELHDPDGSVRIAAEAARVHLSSLVVGRAVFVATHKDGKSFDRYVADVFVPGEDGTLVDIGAAMVAAGHAKTIVAAR